MKFPIKSQWRPTLLLILLTALALSGVRAAQGQTSASENAAPRIISTSPAQREIVGPGSAVKLIFDQPMDRASVEAAFTLTANTPNNPKIDGKFAWSDESTLTFSPTAPLQRGQEYRVSVGAGAKSKAGTPVDEPYKLDFVVIDNLGVTQVLPAPDTQNVQAQSTITVVFNRPVVPLVTTGDQGNLPQPLTLTPAVEGKGEWVGTAIYLFRPAKALAGL